MICVLFVVVYSVPTIFLAGPLVCTGGEDIYPGGVIYL